MIDNVTDEIYYHINTGLKLQIGDTLKLEKHLIIFIMRFIIQNI